MAVTATPIFPQSILSSPVQFNSSTSISTPTTILAAQTNGCKLEAIMVSSTNATPVVFALYVNVSSTNYLMGQVNIPANAGNSATIPAVNILDALTSGSSLLPLPKDANGNPYLYLSSSTTLTALPTSSLTSSDFWNIVCIGGAF